MTEQPRKDSVAPSSWKRWLRKVFGPGWITGASDDDPSGIATYAQAGAQFGYGLSWTLLFIYPFMAVVQEISGRIGRASGHGIAGNIRRHYPGWLLQSMVALLVMANTINIGADLGEMGDVLGLVFPGPHYLYVVLCGTICIGAQVFMKYGRYVSLLKWLTLPLFCYFGAAIATPVDWSKFAQNLFVPSFDWRSDYATMIVAVLGTTISPYLFFWQASQEAEDVRQSPHRVALIDAPTQAPAAITRIRLDTYVGMAFSNLVALAIMVATAASLNASGKIVIQTSAEAAEALRPIAGEFSAILFSLGVLGTGFLAVPVLAGSAAYAIGESRRWPVGLARQPRKAKAFYTTAIIAMFLGVIMNLVSLNPIKALFWSAVINGIVAVPVMACMMMMARQAKIMGAAAISAPLHLVGWGATLLMAASVGIMMWSMLG